MESEDTKKLTKIAALVFGVFSLIGGWLVVFYGGFTHAADSYSKDLTFVDGPSAAIMAIIQFSASAIAFASLFQTTIGLSKSLIASAVFVFTPPVIYLLIN